MGYGLPTSVEIGGESFAIRYDYRAVLEIFEALNDPELNDQERAYVMLQLFYVDFEALTNYDAAIAACFWFIDGGEEFENRKRGPRLVDWTMDFPRIVSPINRVLGYEIRAKMYDPNTNTGGVHWWTFLAAYMEIGDCLFAQIVGIREKKAKGKNLEKSDREFYRKNRDIIDFKTQYTMAEDDILKRWTGGK